MEEKSNPFSVFDQLTAARAKMDESGFKSDGSGVGIDRMQIQRNDERREKAGGSLRARPHSASKRPNTTRLFG